MVKQAIVLAGGLGTRLRDTVPDLPKCMAPVNGQPFLTYVIRNLLSEGVERFIFSLGYKHAIIEEFLDVQFPTINSVNAVEEEPLGTGGAILSACKKEEEKKNLIVKGETLYKVDIEAISSFHDKQAPVCTIALKPMENFDRYGVVEIDKNNIVTA